MFHIQLITLIKLILPWSNARWSWCTTIPSHCYQCRHMLQLASKVAAKASKCSLLQQFSIWDCTATILFPEHKTCNSICVMCIAYHILPVFLSIIRYLQDSNYPLLCINLPNLFPITTIFSSNYFISLSCLWVSLFPFMTMGVHSGMICSTYHCWNVLYGQWT